MQKEDSKCAQDIKSNLSRYDYINERAGAIQESPKLKDFLSPTSTESGVFFIEEDVHPNSYPALSVAVAQILKERTKRPDDILDTMLYLSVFVNERRTEETTTPLTIARTLLAQLLLKGDSLQWKAAWSVISNPDYAQLSELFDEDKFKRIAKRKPAVSFQSIFHEDMVKKLQNGNLPAYIDAIGVVLSILARVHETTWIFIDGLDQPNADLENKASTLIDGLIKVVRQREKAEWSSGGGTNTVKVVLTASTRFKHIPIHKEVVRAWRVPRNYYHRCENELRSKSDGDIEKKEQGKEHATKDSPFSDDHEIGQTEC